MSIINTSSTIIINKSQVPGKLHQIGIYLLNAYLEIKLFIKFALGNVFTREFLTLAIPLIFLWDLLPRLAIVPSTLIPSPIAVIKDFWFLVQNQIIFPHLTASLGRLGLGLVLGIFAGFFLGVLMGWNVFIRKHILPLFQLLAPVPPPAWVPITIILLGVGLPMQTFLVFLGVFYPVLFNTYQGIKDTDPRYIASARVFGASELTILRKVNIPSALGSVIMGIKIGISMGLVMLVIAEMHGGRSGIGYMLLESKEFFQIDRMVVAMAILGLTGWFLIEVMKFIEMRLAQWKKGR